MWHLPPHNRNHLNAVPSSQHTTNFRVNIVSSSVAIKIYVESLTWKHIKGDTAYCEGNAANYT